MKWEIAKAETTGENDSAYNLLNEGWEPFAVTSQHVNNEKKGYANLVETIWFRRQVGQ